MEVALRVDVHERILDRVCHLRVRDLRERAPRPGEALGHLDLGGALARHIDRAVGVGGGRVPAHGVLVLRGVGAGSVVSDPDLAADPQGVDQLARRRVGEDEPPRVDGGGRDVGVGPVVGSFDLRGRAVRVVFDVPEAGVLVHLQQRGQDSEACGDLGG